MKTLAVVYEEPSPARLQRSNRSNGLYRLTLERLRSAGIKASARPELENSQDQNGQGPFRIFAAQIYVEAHFAGRKSLL
jgi:hypothetical protein